MSNKTLSDLKSEAIKKYKTDLNKYEDFNIGDNVKIITPCQDFYFFYEENGKVIKNSHKYLGIKVKFDKPREFKNGYIQTEFNFNPEDLYKLNESLKANTFHRIVERNYPY